MTDNIFKVINDPFPYALSRATDITVLEDLKRVQTEFPDASDPRWHRYMNNKERKLEGSNMEMWGEATTHFANILSGPWITGQLEEAFEIPNLTVDFGGGGYHQIMRNGLLAMHADFSMHPSKPLYRRINLLTFFTWNYWSDCDGILQLGDDENYVAIEPRFGNVVAFATSAHSWHGHPKPWACDQPRQSFAAYYFSPEPPPDYAGPHSTNWMEDHT
jgi:hypothetical protein